MTTTEQSPQSIMDQQRAKREAFYSLWDSKIQPHLAEMTQHATKGKPSAEIAIDLAMQAAWVAFNK